MFKKALGWTSSKAANLLRRKIEEELVKPERGIRPLGSLLAKGKIKPWMATAAFRELAEELAENTPLTLNELADSFTEAAIDLREKARQK